MNWGEIGTQVILGIVGAILSGLGAVITYAVNKYVKNKDNQLKATQLTELVNQNVLDVYQTYVESLKAKNMFTAEAQKEALERCVEQIKDNLGGNLTKYIQTLTGDTSGFIRILVESAIATIKNNNK